MFWKISTWILLISGGCLASAKAQTEAVSPLLASYESYQAKKAETPWHFNWVQTGPVFNSARVEAVQGVPSQPGTFYVAFGSGNLWKTTDHGLTWKPIFEDQPALGIGDFVVSPSHPNTLYVGSGESLKKARNFTMPGVGVFRSDDGGDSWRHLGLPDSYHIGEIIVHPANPEIVFVAVMGHFWSPNPNRGVYRSLDGGITWEHVLYIDDHTGANDIVMSDSDPNVLYASMWNNYPDIAGTTSAVYCSKDGGASWTKAGKGLPVGEGTGRIGLAVSFQNPDKVYALVDNHNKNVKTTSEIYRSLDGGKNWQRTHEADLDLMAKLWYFADIYVNPKDDEEIWGLGIRLAHSSDGGQTFDLIGGKVFHQNPSTAMPLHLDQCELWVNPVNPKHLMLGNDGGFYMSYDGGANWQHYNNIPAGEFYDIAVDHQHPYLIYGGTQDNSSVYGPSSEWNPLYPDGWKYVWLDAWSGGDGCVTYPDRVDPEIIFTSYQNGGIFRKDMRLDRSMGIRPALPKSVKGRLEFNFVAPYILGQHEDGVLYHGGNYLFRSGDRGNSWELISGDLAQSADPERKSLAAGAVAESPRDADLLFVGTDHGAFWVSENQGKSWVERSAGLPMAYIRSIVPSAHDRQRVYVTLTGINYDDLSCHVYRSDDLGLTWIDLGADLPDEVMNCLWEDPAHPEVLVLGGYRGPYLSIDGGKHWDLMGDNLAATCVSDLVYQAESRDLVMGTHGRGIYKLNLSSLYHYLDHQPFSRLVLFQPDDGVAPYYNDTHRDSNPESVKKTTFAFWSPEEQELQFSVKKGMKVEFETTLKAKKGLNEFRWDLVTAEQDDGSPYFIHFKKYLTPANYSVQLDNGSERSEADWVVHPAVYPYK